MTMTRRVSWRRSGHTQVDESCTLTLDDAGVSLVGTVLGAEEGVPVQVEYQVLADAAGITTAAHVRDLRGFEQRTVTLLRDARGRWTVGGAVLHSLEGCTDVDLGCSPATNTLPVRRLQLAVGASATIQAAWVRFPDLTVVPATQTYQRLDASTFRYSSGSFEAELTVDEEGLVETYDEWRRTGTAVDPQCTGPLGARN